MVSAGFRHSRLFLCFLTSKLLFLARVHFLADVALSLPVFICPHTLRCCCVEALHPSSASGLPGPCTPASSTPLPSGSAPSPTDAKADPQPCLCFLTSQAVAALLLTLLFLFLLIVPESLLTPNRGPSAPSCYLGIKEKRKNIWICKPLATDGGTSACGF